MSIQPKSVQASEDPALQGADLLSSALSEEERDAESNLLNLPLSIEVHARLDSIPEADWNRLFPSLPDSYPMICLTQRCGVQGFQFHSLVVYAGSQPILLLPLFSTKYSVLQGYTGFASGFLNTLAQQAPSLFNPTILGVGFVEGEWGQVGYDPAVPEALLLRAWQIAHQALNQLAQSLEIELLAFVDFKQEDAQVLPPEILQQYTAITSYPYGVLPVDYQDLEGYLASLSKATRKDLRRKLKKAQALEVHRTSTPTPEQVEAIFKLYRGTVARSTTSFGVQEIEFFQSVCECVPGTEYTLYHHAGQLIGFNLLYKSKQGLVDKYFGMEPDIGKALNLYFLSWLENVRYCLENGLSTYLAGPAAEEVKCRLGTRMLPTWIYFRHRRPLVHRLLKVLAPQFAYQPPMLDSASEPSADSP